MVILRPVHVSFLAGALVWAWFPSLGADLWWGGKKTILIAIDSNWLSAPGGATQHLDILLKHPCHHLLLFVDGTVSYCKAFLKASSA